MFISVHVTCMECCKGCVTLDMYVRVSLKHVRCNKHTNIYSVTEQEHDKAMERERKERELKKKKEEQDSLTLEQTKEQVQMLKYLLYGSINCL